MRRRKPRQLIFILSVLLTGCASLTPAGEKVMVVHDATYVRGCKSLGEMETTSLWGGFVGFFAGRVSNKRMLRSETAEAGGNKLLIHEERWGMSTYTLAEGFRCPDGR